MTASRTRRELLGAAGTAAAGALLAAGAAAPPVAAAQSAGAAPTPVSETDRLQRLIRLELLLLFCYRHVLASGILRPGAQRRLAPFAGHEEAHIAALEAELKARGGVVPPGPDGVRTANHYLGHRGVGGRLGQLKGDPDALYLLLTLEQVTIGAYFVALTKLQDARLVTLVCEIIANEAQHDAMIGLSLPKATPATAVQYGLVQGLQ